MSADSVNVVKGALALALELDDELDDELDVMVDDAADDDAELLTTLELELELLAEAALELALPELLASDELAADDDATAELGATDETSEEDRGAELMGVDDELVALKDKEKGVLEPMIDEELASAELAAGEEAAAVLLALTVTLLESDIGADELANEELCTAEMASDRLDAPDERASEVAVELAEACELILDDNSDELAARVLLGSKAELLIKSLESAVPLAASVLSVNCAEDVIVAESSSTKELEVASEGAPLEVMVAFSLAVVIVTLRPDVEDSRALDDAVELKLSVADAVMLAADADALEVAVAVSWTELAEETASGAAAEDVLKLSDLHHNLSKGIASAG